MCAWAPDSMVRQRDWCVASFAPRSFLVLLLQVVSLASLPFGFLLGLLHSEVWTMGRKDKPSVSVSNGHCSKLSWTLWHKQHKFIILWFGQSEVWTKSSETKIKVSPSEGSRGELISFPLPASRTCPHSLACGHIPPISAFQITLPWRWPSWIFLRRPLWWHWVHLKKIWENILIWRSLA
jgi:hypothetical protein